MNFDTSNRSHIRGDHVFKEINGKLKFIGDFDSLYSHDDNPWDQSGDIGTMGHYYKHSRHRLLKELKPIDPSSLLEVGCGLGYTTKILQEALPHSQITGMDVSNIAIAKAARLFPDLNFIQENICSLQTNPTVKYDAIILSQLLWYILEYLNATFENCHSLLSEEGILIISQAFMKSPQKYGAHICKGFPGLMSYTAGLSDLFELRSSDLDAGEEFLYRDGLISLRKLER